MPASITTESSFADDSASSAFVTPLATPSGLQQKFAYEDDMVGEDGDERNIYKSNEDGAMTPKKGSQGGRMRSGSQVTARQVAGNNESLSTGDEPHPHEKAFESHQAGLQRTGSRETENSAKGESRGNRNALGLDAEDVKQENLSLVPHRELELEEKEASSSTQYSEKEVEVPADASLEGEMGKSDKIIAPADPVGVAEPNAKAEGVEALSTQEEQEDESQYPGGFSLTILTIGLALATFVVALDNTIIATAIPKITTVFDSLGDVGWYGSSYLLTTTSLQPTFGKIYTYFNVKWTYLTALIIFEVGSIVCAAAVNSTMLIVGRAIAGAGAAALFSGGMNIIGFSVPLRKRAIYIALLSSMFGISSVVGPLLGGVLTDRATWRWCFWINLPFGGVALATVFIFFKNPKRKVSELTLMQKIGQMDLLGAFFLICGIVCLLLALQWGGTVYPWSDSRVWGCLLGFGLITAVFIGLQFWRDESGTIPPRIISQRTIAAGCAFSSFLSMALYSHIYYLPFYFQAVKGTSAEGSGIRTIPYLVSITLASIVVGGLITKLGWYTPFMWAGAAVFTVGTAMLYTLQVDDYAGKWIGYQLLAGIGAGSCIQIPFIAVQVVCSSKDMPTGNALTIFFNSLGGALSISLAQNIFSNTLLQQLQERLPGLDPSTISGSGATQVAQATPPELLPTVLEAYDTAITRAFVLPIAAGGIAFLCGLMMEKKSVKGKKVELAGGA